jgi:hypothetical protein
MKKPLPLCMRCSRQVILADAGILSPKPYLYCKGCKTEVDKWGFEIEDKKVEENLEGDEINTEAANDGDSAVAWSLPHYSIFPIMKRKKDAKQPGSGVLDDDPTAGIGDDDEDDEEVNRFWDDELY